MTASEIQSQQSTYSKTSASKAAAQSSPQKSGTEQTTLPVIEEQLKVGKEVTQHTETVQDTLRRTDIDVEQLSPQASYSQMLDEDVFRQHFQSTYSGSGGKYEDYAHAYRYGATLAGNKRYEGNRWDEVEPQLKTEWESTHAGTPWERTKKAVRYGWEKMSRH